MSAQNTNEEVPIAGINSILPKEHGNKFYTLQILQHLEKDVCAIVSWDSSLHDSQALNRVTEGKVFNVQATIPMHFCFVFGCMDCVSLIGPNSCLV